MLYQPISDIDLLADYPTYDVLVTFEKHVLTFCDTSYTHLEVLALVQPIMLMWWN